MTGDPAPLRHGQGLVLFNLPLVFAQWRIAQDFAKWRAIARGANP
jgi:hypothetical protein